VIGALRISRIAEREGEPRDVVAAGPDNAQIAGRPFLSQKTVGNHVHAPLTKLQAADRAEAIVRGRDPGLGR
jgi:DNA-binding NarL/FixJ family response regulator